MSLLAELHEDVRARLLIRIPQILADALLASQPVQASASPRSSSEFTLRRLMDEYIFFHKDLREMDEELDETRNSGCIDEVLAADISQLRNQQADVGYRIRDIDPRVSLGNLTKYNSADSYLASWSYNNSK